VAPEKKLKRNACVSGIRTRFPEYEYEHDQLAHTLRLGGRHMKKNSIAVAAFAALMVSSIQAQAPALAAGSAPVRAVTARDLDDRAIVGIFDAANTWDIEAAQIATIKSTNPNVTMFANMMIKDHTSVRQLGRDLATKLNVTPTPPAADFALYTDHTD